MNAVIDVLLAPDVRPFAIAGAIMIALCGIELLTLLVGFSIGHYIGKDVDLHAESDSAVAGLMLWINAGRVPFLILLLLTLGLFSIAGFFLQGIAHGAGLQLPVWIAVPAAIAATIPLVRITSRGLSPLIPRDETYAVDEGDFVGQVGVVSIGPLDQGLPGQGRPQDGFGNRACGSA